MKIIAHRGYSKRFTENSLQAFREALAVGSQLIECDVREADGEFYIFHDDNLSRLCGMDQTLASLSREQIEQIRLTNTQPIPTIADVCKLVGERAFLNLEIKSLIHVRRFCDQLAQLQSVHNVSVVLSSFNHPLLENIRTHLRNKNQSQGRQYAALIDHLPIDMANYAVAMQVEIAAISANMVTAEFVQHAHTNCIEVWCYTVNDELMFNHMLELGVDAIFTDDPEWGLRH